MTLDRIYRIINFISAKVVSGNTLTPVNYNDLLPMVSDLIVNAELGKLVQDELTPINDELLSISPLRPFREKTVLAISAGGDATLPADYIRWTSFFPLALPIGTPTTNFSNSLKAIKVMSDHNAAIQQGNIFARAGVKRFCFSTGDGFKFVPYDMGSVEMRYIRKPATPYYDYCQNSVTLEPIYLNPGNSVECSNAALKYFDVYVDEYANSLGTDPLYAQVFYSLPAVANIAYRARTVELEWEDRTHPIIIGQILKKVGINLSDEKLFQLIQENSNI
jgi:hypothetical protein